MRSYYWLKKWENWVLLFSIFMIMLFSIFFFVSMVSLTAPMLSSFI